MPTSWQVLADACRSCQWNKSATGWQTFGKLGVQSREGGIRRAVTESLLD